MENRFLKPSDGLLMCLVVFGMFTQMACTKNEGAGQVRLTMPTFTASDSLKVGSTTPSVSQSGEWNSSINPTVISDVNCFAVFVGGSGLASNSCTVGSSDANATTISFGPNIGFVPAGQSIVLDVPVGQRTVYVIGLRAATASACSSYAGTDPNTGNLSDPFLIASKPANIVSGASTVEITAALDTSQKIIDCHFINSGNGSGKKAFGDKRDGSVTATSTPVPVGTSNLNVMGTRPGNSTMPGTKIIAASRRVTAIAKIDSNAGRLLTLGASFSASEFQAGDEVVWYVAGGNTSAAGAFPDSDISGACGGGLYIGRFGTTKIQTVVSNTQVLLEQSISGSPLTIRTANLAAAPNSGDYCTIVMSRVPNFDTITVPTSTTLTLQAQPFSYTSGTGGILMIRAETIDIASGSTLTIDGSGRGFAGGTSSGSPWYQGDGVNAAGINATNSNYNGGGSGNSSAIGGSGGGHAGPGGQGGGATANNGGGAPTLHCNGGSSTSGGVCLPFSSQKTFMGGGGGGADTSNSGGAGGGIVIVLARTITGSGTLQIFSKGANGTGSSAVGAGAGAGGTAALYTKSATVSAISMSAVGGDGGTVSSGKGGGGGGGGVVDIARCTAFTSAPTTSASGGAAGGAAGGTPGTAGTAGLVRNVEDAAICSAE